MIILGIETSCDETSAAILKNSHVLSNTVCTHLEHTEFGGVVPEIASKNHEKLILNIIRKSIKDANISITDIDGIAVTYGPGLIGSLLVGLNFAKGLSIGLNLPIIGINHLEGHLLSSFINKDRIDYPHLCMLVSGGHTQIVFVDEKDYKIIANTVDDAAGEAFDKGARILGLKYPGGPEIEKLSINGNRNKYSFTIPRVKKAPNNFSFSGLKTALLYKYKNMSKDDINNNLHHLAASYQEVILDTLFDKLIFSLKMYKVNFVTIVGGVSANKRFREKANEISENYNINIKFPDFKFCTDNAAMIAMAGYIKYKEKSISSLDLVPSSNLVLCR